MKLATAILCLAVVSCCSCSPSGSPVSTQHPLFHTTPDKWDQPRIFHTPFDEHWADRIEIDTVPLAEIRTEKVLSPNKAYWYVLTISDTMKPGPHSGTVHVYNERDYLIQIQLLDIKSGALTANWINEKLLYVRTWLGRVLGFDLLFDVEQEKIIYREMVNWGGIPFQQWQQAKEMQQQ